MNSVQIEFKTLLEEKMAQGQLVMSPLRCVCGSEKNVLLACRDRYGFSLDTILCLNCGLVRSDPYFTPDSLEIFYGQFYRGLYNGRVQCDDQFFQEQQNHGIRIIEFLERTVPGRNFDSVGEIGCAAGGILERFSVRGAKVFGCDFSETYVEFGRRKGLRLEVGSHESLPRGMDLLVLSHVIEHVPNPVQFLKDVRLLGASLLYVELPSILSTLANYGDIELALQNAHCWNFSLTTLDGLMLGCGYERVAGNEKIQALYRPVETDSSSFPANKKEAERILKYLRSLEYRRWFSVIRLRHKYGQHYMVRIILGKYLYGKMKYFFQGISRACSSAR